MIIHIPKNGNRIKEGFYNMRKISELLMDNIDNPTGIYYIADCILREVEK